MISRWLSILVVAVACLPTAPAEPFVTAAGELQALHVAENAEVRTRYRRQINGPVSDFAAVPKRVEEQWLHDHRVQVRSERHGDYAYLLFINERADTATFPVATRGTYVIKRRWADGGFVQIKVFLHDDSDDFLRLFPDGDRTFMDVYLKGRGVHRNVLVPMDFPRLLVEPFAEIVKITSRTIPWELLIPRAAPELSQSVAQAVQQLRSRLDALRDADDGAQDEDGTFRFIENLAPQGVAGGFNCSGFAKWVVDGAYYPRAGRYLSIAEVKRKRPAVRGNRWSARYEDERDPYFGLDWSRNLALAAAGRRPDDPEAADVRRVPYLSYVEDVGYPVEALGLALYLLAVREPGHFYLGSVNQPFGSDPVLRQHVHLVVLLPYFDGAGRFHAVVMERNVETSVSSLAERYPGDSVHLVRVPMPDSLSLPPVE